MGKNDLRRAFRKGLSIKQDKILEVNGILGDSAGNVRVAGTNNQVWVRIGGNRAAEKAINDVAPLQPGRAVRLQRDGRIWRVKGTITGSGTGTGTSTGVDRHGFDHYWMAKDPVLVHIRQITALRVEIVSGMTIKINAGTLVILNRPVYVPETTYDLTTYLPSTAGMSKILLISISPAGVVTFTQSSEFAHAALADSQYPTVPTGHFPSAAIRLYSGETEISENKLSTDIRDLRIFANPLHTSEHESGGAQELDVTGLHGVLADAQFADPPVSEDMSSECNSSKVLFVPDYTFVPGTLEVYLNGLRQRAGTGNDYLPDATGNNFEMVDAPSTGDALLVEYLKAAIQTITGPYAPSYGTRAVLVSLNLHGHTTESDGSLSPANYVAMYSALGYGGLAISDHDLITTQPDGITSKIAACEYSPSTGHIGGINAGSYLRGSTTDLQTIINAIVVDGGMAILNHPNWDVGMTYAEMAALTGYLGIEIHNAQCVGLGTSREGWAVSEWDNLLKNIRKDIWGFSTDDYHTTSYKCYGGIGRIKVFVSSNTLTNLLDSITKGCFVADVSNKGVTPGYPVVNSQGVSVECTGAVRIRFLNQDGLVSTVEDDHGSYLFAEADEYIRIEAVGEYVEAFAADVDWDEEWGISGGTWSVGSGELAQSSNTTGPHYCFLKRHIDGDIDMQVDVKLVGTDVETQAGILLAQGTSDYWYFRLAGGSAKNPNTLSLWHMVGGTFTQDPSEITTAFTPATGTWYTIRVQYSRTTKNFKARVWERGTTEPETWGIDYTTPSTYTLNGMVALRCRFAAAFDNLAVDGFKTYYQPIPVGDWTA